MHSNCLTNLARVWIRKRSKPVETVVWSWKLTKCIWINSSRLFQRAIDSVGLILTMFCFPTILVDKNGDVCISILHEPGDDNYGYEKAAERWLPIHTVETILISVISMLADPNDESPANVDAAKEWRDFPDDFKKKVVRCVRRSQEELWSLAYSRCSTSLLANVTVLYSITNGTCSWAPWYHSRQAVEWWD